jgi:hypothetical protein
VKRTEKWRTEKWRTEKWEFRRKAFNFVSAIFLPAIFLSAIFLSSLFPLLKDSREEPKTDDQANGVDDDCNVDTVPMRVLAFFVALW